MRVHLLVLLCGALSVYAFRDWFKALCGLILLMAFIQHPDFPNSIWQVQGLNPWNIALGFVVLAWLVARRREGLDWNASRTFVVLGWLKQRGAGAWDLPRTIAVLLVLYLLVIVVSFVRMIIDTEELEFYSAQYLVSEYLINCIKWVIPGILLFDGARTRSRQMAGLTCTLAIYVLLALQVIRWMPLEAAASGLDLNRRALRILSSEVGYHPVNLSMMLAGASWAILACWPLAKRWSHKSALLGFATVVALAQSLTGGRMGYATWAIIGLVLCSLRWRRMLLVIPVALIGVWLFLPGAAERMLRGFGEIDPSGDVITREYEVTSGRTLVWPFVTQKIGESMLTGYGRLAMIRTDIARQLKNDLGEDFLHPHNAYLECLLDNGLIGLVLILPFYLAVLFLSVRMLRSRDAPMATAVGGVSLCLVLALLVAAAGSQTFYPREGAVGMWCAIGLMLRLNQQRRECAANILQPSLVSARHSIRMRPPELQPALS